MAAAEFFHRLFDQAGIPNTIYPYGAGRANIYAILKGDGTLRPLVLLNHMDVVRADPQNWKVAPFSGEIVNGELYGRGAEDMKDEGLLQAMVMLIAAREHVPLKRDLIFLATADEEVGDTGSAWIIENHPELLRQAEYLITEGGANLIYPNGKTLYEIGVAEKAPFWIRMTATARGGHGSIPIADSAPNPAGEGDEPRGGLGNSHSPAALGRRILPRHRPHAKRTARHGVSRHPQALKDPAFAKALSAPTKTSITCCATRFR